LATIGGMERSTDYDGTGVYRGMFLAEDERPTEETDTPFLQTRGMGACVRDAHHVYTVYNASVVDIIVNHHVESPYTPLFGNFAFPHPLHIHGMDVWVLGQGPLLAGVSSSDPLVYYSYSDTERTTACGHALDAEGNCNYVAAYDYSRLNFVNPPVRDTVDIITSSWVYLRAVMDNPGVWLFHCHLGQHMIDGMRIHFNVMPYSQPSLPEGFEECGRCRSDACEYCSTSSSSTTTTSSTASNTININFANMFNGLTL